MSSGSNIGRRGTPLTFLGILLTTWVCLRAATWDSALAFPTPDSAPIGFDTVQIGEPASADGASRVAPNAPQSLVFPQFQRFPLYAPQFASGANSHRAYPPAAYALAQRVPRPAVNARPTASGAQSLSLPIAPDLTKGHQLLMREAFGADRHSSVVQLGEMAGRSVQSERIPGTQAARPPFTAHTLTEGQRSTDRWMLDAYGFYRQGSGALSVTQGRRPIYGASQLAANLQWRARPSSSHDPRIYARAYHALVTGGESEIAVGGSALPIGHVPVRLYGELRATRRPGLSEAGISSRTDLRPTAFAATEIPPQGLPLGFSLEAYGAGGYVGGKDSTYFADGQLLATRELGRIGNPGSSSGVVSLGAGVWGGAQEGAQRVDIGPTVRFDLNIGDVPARVSVDYREQIAGDAEPDSGVAATVSTRF